MGNGQTAKNIDMGKETQLSKYKDTDKKEFIPTPRESLQGW